MMPRWTCHLIFNANGIVRMSKAPPYLKSGERAVKIKLDVPPRTFARTFPEATIKVPEESIITPTVEVLPTEIPEPRLVT